MRNCGNRIRIAAIMAGASVILSMAACSSGGGAPAAKAGTPSSDSASASASSSDSTSTGKNLIWIQPLRAHPVHRLMQAGFLYECKILGYHCDIVGNDSATVVDIPQTIALADAAMAAKKYVGAGIYLTDPGLYPLVAKIHAMGIPTVNWHIVIPQGTVPGLDATTGADPAAYAREVADRMGQKLGGKGTVALTQGSKNPTEDLVMTTFTEEMKVKYPNIKVLAPQLEGFDPSAAVAKAVSILAANPDVTGAFSSTGGGPETWAGAAQETGRKLTIISMDYVRQNLDEVKSGKVYAIVAQPLFQEGAEVAILLDKLARGIQVPYDTVLPAPLVTAADTAQYYAFLQRAGE
jgi:ribose transport system substrate-binding protein